MFGMVRESDILCHPERVRESKDLTGSFACLYEHFVL